MQDINNNCVKISQVSLTDTVSVSVFEVLVLCGPDELVDNMGVDHDITHTKSEDSQRVLVVVSERALADWTDEGRNQMAVVYPSVPACTTTW